MGKIWLLWIFRLLENTFATTTDLKMLSDTDGHTKAQPQSPCTFMQISLYIILLTQNSIPSKFAFHWLHLHLVLSQSFLLWLLWFHILRHQFYSFCTTEECVYSWFLDRCVLDLNSFCNYARKWWCFWTVNLSKYPFVSCVGILLVQRVEPSLLRTLGLKKYSSWGLYW